MNVMQKPTSLPPERSGKIANPKLLARRKALADAKDAGIWQTKPPPQEIKIAGVRALKFSPSGKSRGTILHIHGGAFRIGCPEQISHFALALAQHCSVTVICPAYRLAPEYPYPAGLNDTRAVMEVLIADNDTPLILSGDSAGGGLAAGLAAMAVNNAKRPAGLVLLSPWLDLTVSSASYRQNASSDPLFSAESAREAAELYLQGHPPSDVLASPLLGSVEEFPPTLINVGYDEVLAGDARQFHLKLLGASIPVQLQIVKAMEHVAVTRSLSLPGAAETFEALVSFINSLLLPSAE